MCRDMWPVQQLRLSICDQYQNSVTGLQLLELGWPDVALLLRSLGILHVFSFDNAFPRLLYVLHQRAMWRRLHACDVKKPKGLSLIKTLKGEKSGGGLENLPNSKENRGDHKIQVSPIVSHHHRAFPSVFGSIDRPARQSADDKMRWIDVEHGGTYTRWPSPGRQRKFIGQ